MASETRNYLFATATQCAMCGSLPDRHRVLGMRLDRSQGLSPKRRGGVAVSVKECRQCRLLFADPMPLPASFDDHYGRPPEEYWVDSYFEEDPDYFSDIIGRAKELLEGRGNIVALDVGAGIGKAMKAMERAGFDVHGLEGSADFRDRAISRFGIAPDRIRLGDIAEARFEPASFDLISFSFVLEHLPNPNEILEKALSWVKPDGFILVEVPNSADIVSRLLNFFFRLRGTNYVANISPMHPPYHLYEFAEKSFELHGRRAGYRVVESHQFTWPFTSLPGWLDKTIQSAQKLSRRPSQLRVWLQPAGAVTASS